MEFSRNIDTLPMKGSMARRERLRIEKAKQVRLVVQGLAQATHVHEEVQLVPVQEPNQTITELPIDNI